ncbi:MAG: hypothetical protein LUE86_14190 [Clostridiales bacterium]|nr:hypothetical protein [Clostridiales bacterium]
MASSYIMQMDQKTLGNEIRKSLWDNPESALAMNFGHTKNLHVGRTNSELLSRLVHDGKPAVSSFIDYDTMMDSVVNAVSYHADKIAGWLQSGRREFENPRDYGHYAIRVDIDGEPLGHGFKPDLKEYETPVVAVILERDLSDHAPFGFVLKTAQETGLSFTKAQVRDENIVDFKGAAEEAAFCLMGEFPGISIHAEKDRCHEEEIAIRKVEEQTHYCAFVKPVKTSCYVREGDRLDRIAQRELPMDMREAIESAEIALKNITLSYRNELTEFHTPEENHEKSLLNEMDYIR